MPADSTDVRVDNHGSIVLFLPLSLAARDWIADHVRADAVWFGGGLAVGPRYASDLAAGMIAAGLVVT